VDLIRPALVAVVTWFLTSILAGVVYGLSTMATPVTTLAAHILWVAALQLAVGLAAAGAAALAHGRRWRGDPRRHAVAAFGPVAVLAVVLGVVDMLTGTAVPPAAVALVAQLAGGALGWLLVSRVLRRTEWRSAPTRGVYF
jgi:hypothetical protein